LKVERVSGAYQGGSASTASTAQAPLDLSDLLTNPSVKFRVMLDWRIIAV
jgi:hypothetical protein